MTWRIHPSKHPPQFSPEVRAFAMNIAMAEALKQTTDLQDVDPNAIVRLGNKWQSLVMGLQKRLELRHGENFDDILVLAWRVNRFSHYYEAALVEKTLELLGAESSNNPELMTASEYQEHYPCGILVAQHYSQVVGKTEILQSTGLTKFPDTGEILEALSLDCVLNAALCLPNDFQKALDLLADSASANQLALQGAQQLHNFLDRKAEKVNNGKAGAEKRHAKMARLKIWTLEKYKAGTWRSANQAACELTPQVLQHSQEINANLTQSNAQRTIAEWIRKSV